MAAKRKAITNRLFLLREISTRSFSPIGQLAGISEEQEEALATVGLLVVRAWLKEV